MGFHKRNITKEIILSNINNIDFLLSSDASVLDDWSSKFIKDIDAKERIIREEIKKELMYSSGCPDRYENYKILKSLSETLISLMTNPSWLDIHFTQDKLGRFTDLKLEEMGVFEILKQKSIDRIIEHFNF